VSECDRCHRVAENRNLSWAKWIGKKAAPFVDEEKLSTLSEGDRELAYRQGLFVLQCFCKDCPPPADAGEVAV
jgi:hypothetical protein